MNGRLRSCDVADELLGDTVGPAIDPMVVEQLLRVLLLRRVLEAEPAPRVAVVARVAHGLARIRREEPGDELRVAARTHARPVRVERAAGQRSGDVAVHLPGDPRKQVLTVLALPDNVRTRIR